MFIYHFLLLQQCQVTAHEGNQKDDDVSTGCCQVESNIPTKPPGGKLKMKINCTGGWGRGGAQRIIQNILLSQQMHP